ncbi:hypothetical protein [Streptomyces meridianus]|uniref:Uncharacterized protein n=1 Tax=Streptomyces meridianus TaxID=2938945 RepID=A0ABT0X2M0_9ACTN|nr:hypothetical protein [Streptomyces meridianus]MCM2576791.1 hypothetical protein [Streptomyces meridianus]
MSQNGQGNEPHLPAVPPAREGVVLPSSGPRSAEPAHGGSWAPDPQGAPAAGQPWGQPWGPDSAAAAQPQQDGAWGSEPGGGQSYPGGTAAGDAHRSDGGPGLPPGGPYPSQPGTLPPAAPPAPPAQPPGQMPPYQQPPYPQAGPPPSPAAADETQMLPPQQPHASPFDGSGQRGGAPGAGSWPPPGPDSEATRFMPPASGTPGAPLPPEEPAEPASERTAFLGRRRPHQGAPGGPGADADATRVMGVHAPPPATGPGADGPRHAPPVAGGEPPRPSSAPFGIRPGMPGDRPPPAEFDGLFRSDSAPEGDRTRHMPPAGGDHPPYGPQGAGPSRYEPQSRAGRRNAASSRGLSTAAIIGIVVAACAVVGLAAGAALSSGDDASDGKKPGGAGAGQDKEPKGPGPAVQQAKALDALLADSNNSRSKVIRAVASIKTCTNLDAAAKDLREAANQRKSLVARLAKTKIDSLPARTELAGSLNAAWKASASADLHYAAWAEQVGGKKGCHKGKARATAHTAAGNRASGDATVAKKRAAQLWNAIAREHGLTERQYGQL